MSSFNSEMDLPAAPILNSHIPVFTAPWSPGSNFPPSTFHTEELWVTHNLQEVIDVGLSLKDIINKLRLNYNTLLMIAFGLVLSMTWKYQHQIIKSNLWDLTMQIRMWKLLVSLLFQKVSKFYVDRTLMTTFYRPSIDLVLCFYFSCSYQSLKLSKSVNVCSKTRCSGSHPFSFFPSCTSPHHKSTS